MNAGVSPQGSATSASPGRPSRPADPLEIHQLPIDQLLEIAAPYNPRQIDEEELEALKASLEAFGWVEPCVVNRRPGTDELVMVGGHQRTKAAAGAGWTEGPVVYVQLEEPKERALNLALNKISGRWDDDLLGKVLAGLRDEAADLIPATGFREEAEDLIDEALGEIDHSPIDPATIFGEAPPIPQVGAPPAGQAQAPSAEASPRLAYGGATAIGRGHRPMRLWQERGLLKGRVLDFGAGQHRHAHARYDPFTAPDPGPLLERWDTITCNYVLNVQPADHLVTQILALLRALVTSKGVVCIAVRSDGAGGWTSRGYQAKRRLAEWQAFLEPFFRNVKASTESGFYAFECRR